MKSNSIDINIWDDYYEEGYIPDGQIQETFIYVESNHTIPEEALILNILLEYIQKNITYLNGVKMWLELYDSRKKYPEMTRQRCEESGIDYDRFHYQRYQIIVQHMTHVMRERLVEDLQKSNLSFNEIKFHIYSES